MDLNNQVNVANGDFLGFPLSAAGVTLNQDFSFSAKFSNFQFGTDYDQIGLFVGTSIGNAFRGGELFNGVSNGYTVSTQDGTDVNLATSAAVAPNVGDTVVFILSRTSGVWAFTLQDMTTPSKSGSIPINQPTFLNGVLGLVAGVYAGNAEIRPRESRRSRRSPSAAGRRPSRRPRRPPR